MLRLQLTFLQEVKLTSSSTERDLFESLAEIYSIIVTLDGLEKAYIKDAVTESEYTETCARLLKQYKSSLSDDSVAREFVDLETFKRRWEVGLRGITLQVSLIADIYRWNALELQSVSALGYLPPLSKPHMAHTPQVMAWVL
jgi:VPS28 protein